MIFDDQRNVLYKKAINDIANNMFEKHRDLFLELKIAKKLVIELVKQFS